MDRCHYIVVAVLLLGKINLSVFMNKVVVDVFVVFIAFF